MGSTCQYLQMFVAAAATSAPAVVVSIFSLFNFLLFALVKS